MKNLSTSLLMVIASSYTLTTGCQQPESNQKQPNVIIILTDDQG